MVKQIEIVKNIRKYRVHYYVKDLMYNCVIEFDEKGVIVIAQNEDELYRILMKNLYEIIRRAKNDGWILLSYNEDINSVTAILQKLEEELTVVAIGYVFEVVM